MHGSATTKAERLEKFKSQFDFDPRYCLWHGVERECFLVDKDGQYVPRAHDSLSHIHRKTWSRKHRNRTLTVDPRACVGYELSAVQLETRTPPHQAYDTEDYLRLIDINLRNSLNELGLCAQYDEVAPETIPLDVYPDPDGRYQRITAAMQREVLLSACRIIGTHGHVGMPNHDVALDVYNAAAKECRKLMQLGDGSNGERLRIYRIVKPDHIPRPYHSWDDFCDDAHENGFADDPRSNWRMIRITKYGTIEFRPFGATHSIDRVCSWMHLCHIICKDAM